MDLDEVGVTGDRFVHRVVDDFGEEVMQRLLVGAADIHAGAHAHGLEAFEHADGGSVVVRRRRTAAGGIAGCGAAATGAAAFSAGAAAFCVASGFAVSGTPEKRSLLSSMELFRSYPWWESIRPRREPDLKITAFAVSVCESDGFCQKSRVQRDAPYRGVDGSRKDLRCRARNGKPRIGSQGNRSACECPQFICTTIAAIVAFMPFAVASERLRGRRCQPFKDELFSSQTVLESHDNGAFETIDYQKMRDINGRDQIPEKRAKPAYLSLGVRWNQTDETLMLGGRKARCHQGGTADGAGLHGHFRSRPRRRPQARCQRLHVRRQLQPPEEPRRRQWRHLLLRRASRRFDRRRVADVAALDPLCLRAVGRQAGDSVLRLDGQPDLLGRSPAIRTASSGLKRNGDHQRRRPTRISQERRFTRRSCRSGSPMAATIRSIRPPTSRRCSRSSSRPAIPRASRCLQPAPTERRCA